MKRVIAKNALGILHVRLALAVVWGLVEVEILWKIDVV
jgi:hypothetical protein